MPRLAALSLPLMVCCCDGGGQECFAQTTEDSTY